MLAVFGLGNPGTEYRGTRHNVGFEVIDKLAEQAGVRVSRRRFHARMGEMQVHSRTGVETVLLVKPQTFMNDSGLCVQAVAAWHRLDAGSLLVVCDDLDLTLGAVRVRRKGSSGGHRGLQSIAEALGTTEFPRLRIGIGRPEPREAIDYVLDVFEPAQREVIVPAIARAAEAVACWAAEGVDACMNRFN